MAYALESSRCVTRGHFIHTSSSSCVDTHLATRVAQNLDNRCLMSCCCICLLAVSHSCRLRSRLCTWLTLKLENPPVGCSRHAPFMIYEVWIEAWISPCDTESQTYTSQLKYTAGKRRARRANGSVLLRNRIEAVLPAAVKNNSVVFRRNEQVRAKTESGRNERLDVVDAQYCKHHQVTVLGKHEHSL